MQSIIAQRLVNQQLEQPRFQTPGEVVKLAGRGAISRILGRGMVARPASTRRTQISYITGLSTTASFCALTPYDRPGIS